MGLQSDLILLFGTILVLTGVAFGFGYVELPGTQTTQIPDSVTGGDGETQEPRQEPRYVVNTQVDVRGDLVDAKINDFRYSTSQCNVLGCGLSFTGSPSDLYFGAKNVYVSIILNDENGEKIASTRKSLDRVEQGEIKTARHQFSNVPQGIYEVDVILEGRSGDVFDPNNEFIRSKTYNIQVPESADSVTG